VRVRVPAKVNLVLAVGERLACGDHRVSTILQAVDLFDRVTAAPGRGLRLACGRPDVPAGAGNLAWRAAEAVARRVGRAPDVRLTLRKSIPVGAGLGGGSADAAAALVACNALWEAGLDRGELAALGAGLGADVPFFLWGGTARGEGRGERITPLDPLPAWPCLVAVPAQRKPSTRAAYEALDRLGAWSRPELGRAARARTPAELAAALGNSFEALGRPRLPVEGALGTVLAGSGTGLFSLAPSFAWARRAARRLRLDGWFARACRLWPGGAEVLP
jgi:4-diphosphocytidyl-2-C-methyl-D-erythritol kinase